MLCPECGSELCEEWWIHNWYDDVIFENEEETVLKIRNYARCNSCDRVYYYMKVYNQVGIKDFEEID